MNKTNSYDIPGDLWKAALAFADKNHIRPCYRALFFESKDGNARIYGCNGHALAVGRFSVPPELPPQELLIPPEALAKAKPQIIGYRTSEVRLDVLPGIGHALNSVFFTPLDTWKPEYRLFFPLAVSGEPAQLSPAYVGLLEKSRRGLLSKAPALAHYNGSREATLFTFDGRDDFLALILPLRLKPDAAPMWGRDPL